MIIERSITLINLTLLLALLAEWLMTRPALIKAQQRRRPTTSRSRFKSEVHLHFEHPDAEEKMLALARFHSEDISKPEEVVH